MVLEELDSTEDHAVDVSNFELLDVHGLDQASLDALRQAPNRPEVVFCWLPKPPRGLDQCGHGQRSGAADHAYLPGLWEWLRQVSPGAEVLGRASAVSVRGRCGSHAVYVHTLFTPIVMCIWFASGFQVFIFTYILVFPLWSLFVVAGELENPFGKDDMNDLNTAVLQTELNAHLLALVRGPGVAVPNLRYSGIPKTHMEVVADGGLGHHFQTVARRAVFVSPWVS